MERLSPTPYHQLVLVFILHLLDGHNLAGGFVLTLEHHACAARRQYLAPCSMFNRWRLRPHAHAGISGTPGCD
jgi:hypothetical protein